MDNIKNSSLFKIKNMPPGHSPELPRIVLDYQNLFAVNSTLKEYHRRLVGAQHIWSPPMLLSEATYGHTPNMPERCKVYVALQKTLLPYKYNRKKNHAVEPGHILVHDTRTEFTETYVLSTQKSSRVVFDAKDFSTNQFVRIFMQSHLDTAFRMLNTMNKELMRKRQEGLLKNTKQKREKTPSFLEIMIGDLDPHSLDLK